MKENEKRGAPRVPYITEVACEGAGTRLIARTSDISASGVFIHSKLCCDAGSILRVTFAVNSVQIDTLGEVCYSMTQVGMGIRFIDLKPEYREAIDKLIESRLFGGSETISGRGVRLTASGVEPVDKLIGGLERGHLYMAHGDAAGKSLFGIQFLIEGLRNGQRSTLITTQTRVDAVRRFTRLGYDCVGDVRRGSLVLLRSSNDLREHVLQLGRLEPLLGELEPVLSASSPDRIVFDPVNNLLAGRNLEEVTARADELAVWLRSFGATVVLVANLENSGVIEGLTRSVKESFRFGVRETHDRVVRFIAFEKSESIPDQPVRVDPSRGISLLEDQQTDEPANQPADAVQDTCSSEEVGVNLGVSSTVEPTEPDLEVEVHNIALFDPSAASNPETQSLNSDAQPTEVSPASQAQTVVVAPEKPSDAFFAMLNELHSFATSLDRDSGDQETSPVETPF